MVRFFLYTPVYFESLNIEKIKELRELEISEWGNQNIVELTKHFKLLSFSKFINQKGFFDEKVMLNEYKMFDNEYH